MIADALGSKLIHLITEQRYYLRFVQLRMFQMHQPTREQVRLVYAIQRFVEYHPLSLPFEKFDDPIISLQDCVRLALYISAQPVILGASPSSAFIRTLTTQLKASLEKVNFLTNVTIKTDFNVW